MSTKNEKVTSPTGVFRVEGKTLVPIMEKASATVNYPANSMGAFVENLGYTDDQTHWAHTYASDKVQAICFARHTKLPILVLAKDKTQSLSWGDVEREVQVVNWAVEMMLW